MAAHQVRWLGPALADALRYVIGTDAVSRLEDVAYGVADRWKRFWREGEQPKAYWDVPAASANPVVGAGDRDLHGRDALYGSSMRSSYRFLATDIKCNSCVLNNFLIYFFSESRVQAFLTCCLTNT